MWLDKYRTDANRQWNVKLTPLSSAWSCTIGFEQMPKLLSGILKWVFFLSNSSNTDAKFIDRENI